MIKSVENMKTIPNYGIWLFWTESNGKMENVHVLEGYLDYLLLRLGSRYENIHVKQLETLDLDNQNPPYARTNKVHFFLHDMNFTNLSLTDRRKYLESMMIGRHADLTDEEITDENGIIFYTLERHLTLKERRQKEIDEILNKLDEVDRNRLIELWKEQNKFTSLKNPSKKNIYSNRSK